MHQKSNVNCITSLQQLIAWCYNLSYASQFLIPLSIWSDRGNSCYGVNHLQDYPKWISVIPPCTFSCEEEWNFVAQPGRKTFEKHNCVRIGRVGNKRDHCSLKPEDRQNIEYYSQNRIRKIIKISKFVLFTFGCYSSVFYAMMMIIWSTKIIPVFGLLLLLLVSFHGWFRTVVI